MAPAIQLIVMGSCLHAATRYQVRYLGASSDANLKCVLSNYPFFCGFQDFDLRDTAPPSTPSGLRPYQVRYSSVRPQPGPQLLACIEHGARLRGPATTPASIHVDLALLAGPRFEVWESVAPVQTGEVQDISYSHNDSVLFGQFRLSERALEQTEQNVFRAYAQIDDFLRQQGYPNWLRAWNYLGNIHKGDGDEERYRQFVAGRSEALALKSGFENELPAATAVGTASDGLLIYFLAAKTRGLQVENSRQISAFKYPRQYGPRSPSFSRAMLVPWADHSELMVSGTASVVGHETLHAGDPEKQLAESIENMKVLLQSATELLALSNIKHWQTQAIKLYVREDRFAEQAMATLSQYVAQERLIVMRADICRSDLSLEFEGHFIVKSSP